MMDTFALDFLQENYPNSISINYMKETLHNEKVSILKEQTDSEFLFEGTNQNNNMSSFRGKIIF